MGRWKQLTKGQKADRIIFTIVTLALIGTLIYAIVGCIIAPAEVDISEAHKYDKLKSEYILTAVMCAFALLVIFLPSIFAKKFKMVIPSFMHILFVLFLFGAAYLGEANSFYYKLSYWDDILHTMSSMMTAAMGFSIVLLLNKTNKVNLNPLFLSIFAFCFALAIGGLWEIIEYVVDAIGGLNSQKFLTPEGVALVGRAALEDTMTDLIVDAAAAFITSAIGFISLKGKGRFFERILIRPLDYDKVKSADIEENALIEQDTEETAEDEAAATDSGIMEVNTQKAEKGIE